MQNVYDETCFSIFNHNPEAQERVIQPLHRSWASFQQSVAAQCHICLTVAEGRRGSGWEKLNVETSFVESEFRLCELETNTGDPKPPRPRSKEERDLYWGQVVHFDILPETEPTKATKLGFLATQQHSTRHNKVTNLVKHWLSNCNELHQECKRHVSSEKLYHPTRLLDVSGEIITLIDSQRDKAVGPYASLSHCWGPDKFFTLTPENQVQLRQGIHVTEFPQSFQDAFLTIRNLELHFLWVDSFCIYKVTVPRRYLTRTEKRVG